MSDVRARICELLASQGVTPILVDVGASGGPPEDWSPIAARSHYIGFDPDLREIRDEYGGGFARSTMVAEAVTPHRESSDVTFYLTASPFCSSVLAPDLTSLDQWTFRPLFEVSRTATVPATTLDRVLDRLELASVDWLKLDTQGTDLRIAQSISRDRFAHLLALDVEPGLIDAYVGEDLFVDVHRALVASGFWLSGLNIQGSIRARASSLHALHASDPVLASRLQSEVRPSPGWCEARYLRTVESVDWSSQRDPLLLWAFSMLDQQVGAAVDLCLEWQSRSGPPDLLTEMLEVSAAALLPSRTEQLIRAARQKVPTSVRRAVRRLIPR